MNPFAMGRKQNSLRDGTLCLRMVDYPEAIQKRASGQE
jgi:hypothetical protein